MARVPVAGRVKTRLCPPLTQDQAARLARCFLQDRLEQLGGVAAASPLVAFTPADLEAELHGSFPPACGSSLRRVPTCGFAWTAC
jgi:glycosyltransferase A (GT-A) superfamily protein (DUF2064 family)